MRLFGFDINFNGRNSYYDQDPAFHYKEIGDNNPVYVDLTDLNSVYHENSLLKLVINKRADMLSNLQFVIKDNNGEEIEDDEVLSLLISPNPLQSGKEFIKNLSIQRDIFGNSFCYKLQGINSIPSALWVLPSSDIKVKKTDKYFLQTKIDKIIEYYELESIQQKFEVKEIIHFKDQDSNLIVPESKIKSLQQQVSNIRASYESRNKSIQDRGALGILSISGDNTKGVLMSPQEKDSIERQLTDKYGIRKNQRSNIVTSANVKYESMTFPVKDLMLHEEEQSSFIKICDMYGLNANIFSSVKGSTFDNVKESIKQAYQDTIIPLGKDIANKLTQSFGLENKYIDVKFDVAVLKEDELKKQNTIAIEQETILEQLDRRLITEQETKEKLGI